MPFPEMYALEISEKNWALAFALVPHSLAQKAPEDYYGSFVVINVLSTQLYEGGTEAAITLSNIIVPLDRFADEWTYPNPQNLVDDNLNLVLRMPEGDSLEKLRRKINRPVIQPIGGKITINYRSNFPPHI